MICFLSQTSQACLITLGNVSETSDLSQASKVSVENQVFKISMYLMSLESLTSGISKIPGTSETFEMAEISGTAKM